MIESPQASRVEFEGDGVTVEFDYPHYFRSKDDLRAAADGVLLTIVSATGEGNPAGGAVTFSAAPADGAFGVIRQLPEVTQKRDYTTGEDLPVQAFEDGFDKLTLIAQALSDKLDRGFIFSDWAQLPDDFDPAMPAPVAGGVLKIKADLSGVEFIESNDIETLADLSDEMEALAAITGAISTVAGISANVATVAGVSSAISSLGPIAAAISTAAANITAIQNAAANATAAAASASAASASETSAAADAATVAADKATVLGYKNDAQTAMTAAEAAQAAAEDAEASIQQALNGVVFEWDTGTADANPGAGAIRANNASVASATFLYVNESDGLGAAISAVLDTWDDSTSTTRAFITLRKRAAPLNFVMFAVSGAQTDAGAYRKFPVSYIGHSGSFNDGDVIGVIVERTGDKGNAGAGTGDMLVANALSELAAVGSTARGNIAAAPNSPDYLVKTANAELTSERVITDTPTVAVDWATAGQAKFGVVAGSIGATQLASDGVTTVKILNNNVTLAKIQQITTDRLLGRDTTGTGDVEQLTVGGGIEFTGSGGIQRSALSGGDVTASAGSAVLTIGAGVVTYSKMASAAIAAASDFRANSASKLLDAAGVWSAAGVVTLTDAATIAVDMSTFLNAKVTLGGNRTLGQPSNAKVGQSGCIEIIQDATGSRTLAYHADWYFAGGSDPTLSTAANARDLLFYQVMNDGKIFGTLVKAVA